MEKIPQNVGSIYHPIRLSILNPVISTVLFYSIFFLSDVNKSFDFIDFFFLKAVYGEVECLFSYLL